MPSKTRKNKNVLTIPQLRRSFHAVESYLAKEVRNGKTRIEDLVKGFRHEWKKHFRRDLSVSAARSYVNHMRERLVKGFRGGAYGGQLTGAPLDLTTRPGVYGQHGNFLEYVNTGFVNPEPGIKAECGSMDFTPVLPKDMGSNQAGGKRSDPCGKRSDPCGKRSDPCGKRRGKRSGKRTRKATRTKQRGGVNPLTGAPYASEFRPFVAQTPQTFQASIQDSIKGMPPVPSADPTATAFQYKMSPHIAQIPGVDVAGLDRNLLKDVVVPY
jgi:hypothetical protein